MATTSLDLSKIKGSFISGLAEDEINFIEELIQKDIENPDNIFDQFTGYNLEKEKQFESFLDFLNSDDRQLTTEEMKEIEHLENEGKCQSTEKQTRHYVQMFLAFLKENKLPEDLKGMPVRYVESYLRLWFSRLRKKDGNLYSPNTLACCRAAIHRYMLETRNIPLIDNDQFSAFHRTYKACITKSIKTKQILTSEGGSGYSAIEPEDMERLRIYFNRSSPERLQDEVFFLILYHFGFRGREWLRNLTTQSLKLKESKGTRFVDFEKCMAEKNVRYTNQAIMRQIVMTETPATKENCPVEAVETYLAKLPSESPLFPKPCKKYQQNGKWYCEKEVLGKNSLNDLMKTISIRAGLSRTYTNHSVRSTCVTNLRKSGFTAEQCQLVTGHNRVESIHRYDKRRATERITFAEKRSMSEALSERLNNYEGSTSGESIQTIVTQKSISFQAGESKRMKIKADGSNNIVQITFE